MKLKKKYIIIIITLLILFGIEQFLFYNLSDKEKTKSDHIYGIESYVSTDKLVVKKEDNPIILFASDYQGEDRYSNVNYLFNFTSKHVKPNLFVMCGDYRVSLDNNYTESENGILELSRIFNKYFGNVPIIMLQGNHDLSNTYGLVKKQYFVTSNYIIYNINNDDFPNNQDVEKGSEETVKNTASKLNDFLEKQEKTKIKKPIFIVSHVPLHYTDRNNGGDNKYAKYLFDVINKYSKNLDIVFLFGHNHSGKYDDYIGGSVNYIAKGENINVGGTNKKELINFTYMNAGYIGFSNNTNSATSTNDLTVSSIKVKKDLLEIQRYTMDKLYYENSIIVKRINKNN